MKTRMNRFSSSSRLLPGAVLALSALAVSLASAANNDTWLGNTSINWNTPANWDVNAGPAAGDSLFFQSAGSAGASLNNDIPASTAFGQITFDGGADAFTLSGNSLTITNPADAGAGNTTGGGINDMAANTETISLPLTLSSGLHVLTTGAGAGALNLSGNPFTRNTGATVQFLQSGGSMNVSGTSLANVNSILGGWAFIGSGNAGTSGNDWAALDGSGNVIPYAGYTPLAAGSAFTSDGTKHYQISTAGAATTLAAAGVTDIGSLSSICAASQVIGIASGQTLRVDSGGIINANGGNNSRNLQIGGTAGTGFLTAGAGNNTPGELTLIDLGLHDVPSAAYTVNAVVTNNGSGAVRVNVLGYVNFKASTNTFSGGLYVNAGRAATTGANGGTGANSFGPDGANVYVFPGAQALLGDQNTTYKQNFFVSGVGNADHSGYGVLRLSPNSAGTQTLAGTLTLLGSTRISLGSGLNGTISGQITGTGPFEIADNVNGNATLTLSNPNNNWTGGLEITSASSASRAATVKLGADNVIPAGDLTLNAGNNANSDTATLDMNGHNNTANGLISTATFPSNNRVTNSTATVCTLTVGNNNATSTFGGIISGTATTPLALTKIGTGSLSLGGANTYTGNTTISGGALLVNGSLASGSVVSLGAGALGGSGTVNGPVTTTSASAQINQELYYAANLAPATLTLGSSLNLSGGGACYLDLSTSHLSGNDQIAVTGALTLNNTAFHLNALGGATDLDSTGDYVLIQAGSISGTLSASPVWDGTAPSNRSEYIVAISGTKVVLHNTTYNGPIITSATATPDHANHFQSVLLSVTVSNGIMPYTVTVDASSIGQSASLSLVPNGSGHVFTNTVALSSAALGSYSLQVTAMDNAFQTANALIALTVTPVSLTWNGDASGNSFWGVSGELEWQGGLTYEDTDLVRFDDTATGLAATNVNLVAGLSPGGITVSNTAGLPTANYTFQGAGGISGSAPLTKQGSGTLTLTESGGDNFGGVITVSNGTLVLDQTSAIISGSLSIAGGATAQLGANDMGGAFLAGPVTMNGVLTVNRTDDLSINVAIGGVSTGTLIKTNSNTLSLATQNSFAGNVSVTGGTLQFTLLGNGVTSALGAVAAGRTITVGPSATLSGGQNWFGGGPSIDASYPTIVVNGGTLDTTVYTSVGSVILNNGAMWTNNNSTGGASYGSYQIRGSVTVGGTSPSAMGTSNAKGFNLNTNTVFNVADVTGNAAVDLTVSAPLWNNSGDFSTAPGGFTKAGAGTMLLTATNTYTGNTVVGSGVLAMNDSASISSSANVIVAGGATLDVSGRTDGTLTLASGQTLSGNGTVLGSVTEGAGATIAPGSSIGALTATNAVLLSGTTLMEIDATAGTNDQIKGAQTITYGGTLTVTNISGPPAVNQAFKLFSAANYGGSFAVANLPALTSGLGWNINNLPLNGTIKVVAAGPTTNANILSVSLVGTTLLIHGTNNNGGQNFHYAVLTSTNVALPLTNWTALATNSFNLDGTFDYTNPITPGAVRQFFDTLAVP
jgi:fibronectin-binding autotransporter adhesin